ncbi:hypothetical protein FGO68_gene1020 [Halteria grandinella]|uniref:MORN repeat protein n=1 Tax=Halteria grandinella TaxID=5974 RepID=A0A8J8NR89_HALGN|nr:hypothetical protein FGO68_gene1020 [Halteria grandinella]
MRFFVNQFQESIQLRVQLHSIKEGVSQQSMLLDDHTFNSMLLGRFIESMNIPLGEYVPFLNDNQQSTLAQTASDKMFIPSLDVLNSHICKDKTVQMIPFEGLVRQKNNKLANGVYYGQLLNGKRDGFGQLYAINCNKEPEIYCCHWSQGIPTKGRWLSFDIKGQCLTYEGGFNELYLAEGFATLLYGSGGLYSGYFKSGKRSGFGKLIWKKGEYTGEWRDNKFEGQGEIRFHNGTIYKGQFIADDLVKGTHLYKNGSRYDGMFINEQFQGMGKLTYGNGIYQRGEWHRDQKIGEHKIHGKDGTLMYAVTFNNDRSVKVIEML